MEKQKIITRSEALEKALPSYFTGVPCKRGHIAKRATANSCCFECMYESTKAKRAEYKAKREAA